MRVALRAGAGRPGRAKPFPRLTAKLPACLACRAADDKVDAVVDAGAVEAVVPLLTLRTELPLGPDGQPPPPCASPSNPASPRSAP